MPVIVKFDNTTTCPQQAQVLQDAPADGWAIEFTTDGTKLQIRVTGSAGDTVKWSVHSAANYNIAP